MTLFGLCIVRRYKNTCYFLVTKMHKKAIFSKTIQFSAMVFIDDLQEVVHRLFKEYIIGPLTSIFFCRDWSDLEKKWETVAE